MVQTIPPTVLLTRPKAASERFAMGIKHRVVISPVQEIVWVEDLAPIGDADAIVFTSENGVAGFSKQQDWRGTAYCVGDRTAQAARDAGFHAQSAGGDLNDLKDMLRRQAQGAQLIHARGRYIAGDLGDLAEPLVVYEQRDMILSVEAVKLLRGKDKVIVPFFSPRSARAFAQQLTGAESAPLVVITMSAAVSQACKEAGLGVSKMARTPDGLSMRDAIEAVTS